jgi:DNA-binding transcriptional LysR family regulator
LRARAHGAAQPLGIDHSTVYRRLQAIEARLGIAMFERLPGGVYMPTEDGDRAVTAAERIEAEVLGLARDIAGRDMRLVGRLRVTSSETLAPATSQPFGAPIPASSSSWS